MTRRAALASGLAAETVDHLPAAGPDAALIRFDGMPGQLVAVDAVSIRRLARRMRCQITLLVRMGDGARWRVCCVRRPPCASDRFGSRPGTAR